MQQSSSEFRNCITAETAILSYAFDAEKRKKSKIFKKDDKFEINE